MLELGEAKTLERARVRIGWNRYLPGLGLTLTPCEVDIVRKKGTPEASTELGTTIEELQRDVLCLYARQLIEERSCGGCRAQSQKLLKLLWAVPDSAASFESWRRSKRRECHSVLGAR